MDSTVGKTASGQGRNHENDARTVRGLRPRRLFDRDGFLIFPGLLSPAEVETLRAELARVSQIPDRRIMREKFSGEPRIV